MSDPQAFSCQVAVEEPGRVVVATLAGRLGPEEAETFRERVDAEHRDGGRRFVFDLGRLSYVGMPGCGCSPFSPPVSRVTGWCASAIRLHPYSRCWM